MTAQIFCFFPTVGGGARSVKEWMNGLEGLGVRLGQDSLVFKITFFGNTVKPVYNGHHWDPKKVAVV